MDSWMECDAPEHSGTLCGQHPPSAPSDAGGANTEELPRPSLAGAPRAALPPSTKNDADGTNTEELSLLAFVSCRLPSHPPWERTPGVTRAFRPWEQTTVSGYGLNFGSTSPQVPIAP